MHGGKNGKGKVNFLARAAAWQADASSLPADDATLCSVMWGCAAVCARRRQKRTGETFLTRSFLMALTFCHLTIKAAKKRRLYCTVHSQQCRGLVYGITIARVRISQSYQPNNSAIAHLFGSVLRRFQFSSKIRKPVRINTKQTRLSLISYVSSHISHRWSGGLRLRFWISWKFPAKLNPR